MNTAYWCIEYLATLVEMIMSTVFIGIFVGNEKYREHCKLKLLIDASGAFVIILINTITLFSVLMFMAGLMIEIIINILIYRKNYLKILFYGFLYMMILFMSDNMLFRPVFMILDMPLSDLFSGFSIYRVVILIMSKTFLTMIILTIQRIFINRKIQTKKYSILILAISFLINILSISITLREVKQSDSVSVTSVFLFVMMYIIIIMIFFGVYQITEYYTKLNQLQLTKLKNHMLEESISETKQTFELWKNSMHDYKHNVINLISLAENGDISGIKEYLKKENELIGRNVFYYETGNDTVDAILYVKQRLAEENGIKFMISAEIPEECNIPSEYFASVLGNLLDNSIEASLKETEPYIEVKIKPQKSFLTIVISNKSTHTNTALKTTKHDSYIHGIGLNSVKHTVNLCNGEFSVSQNDDYFTASILLPL